MAGSERGQSVALRQKARQLLVVVSARRRIFKTALAAGGSWSLAGWLLSDARPYFAPLAAILALQITVAESLRASAQRILGVVVGVALALFLARLAGLSGLSVAALVFVALSGAAALRMPPAAAVQVAISGLLVATVGAGIPGYAWHRIVETVIGAALAVAINAAIAPADHLDTVEQALARLAAGLGRLFEELGGLVGPAESGDNAAALLARARALHSQEVAAVHEALALAAQGLKWNYFGASKQPRLARCKQISETLERVLIMLRGIIRTLSERADSAGPASACEALRTGPPRLRAAVVALIESCRAALAAVEQHLAAPGCPPGCASLAAVGTARLALSGAVEAEPQALGRARWIWLGSVTTDLLRIARELAEAFPASPGNEA